MVTDDGNRDSWDVVVVGGGSAGLAAALTLSRALRNTLVIDGGGQRNGSADHSHGVLGFEGIAPSHLLDVGRHEIATFGGHVRTDRVTSARRNGQGSSCTPRQATGCRRASSLSPPASPTSSLRCPVSLNTGGARS